MTYIIIGFITVMAIIIQVGMWFGMQTRRLDKHQRCLANIERLERELGIGQGQGGIPGNVKYVSRASLALWDPVIVGALEREAER